MLIAVLLARAAWAEAPPLTLEDALSRTVGASESVAIADAAIDRARSDRMRVIAGVLPQLSFSGSYRRTIKTEFTRLLGQAGSTLPFGRPNSYTTNFSLSQPIYGGGRAVAGFHIAADGQLNADLGLDAAKAQAALDTAKAWYDAALASRLLQISEESRARAQKALADVTLGHEVGRRSDFDLLRAKVDVENQQVAVLRQQRARDVAVLRLAQLLDLEPGAEIVLPTDFDVADDVAAAAVGAAEVGDAPEGRVPVLQAEAAERIAASNLRVTRAAGYPSVSANLSYGWTSYPEQVWPTFNPDNWYPNLNAGLSVSVPIFAGGAVRGQIVRSKADLAEAHARAEQAAELTALDSRDAALELQTAEAAWAATEGTAAQARRAFEIAELRSQEGVISPLELADARLLLDQALANRAQAARDLQVARIRTALLPWLPLSSGAR